MEFWIFVLIMNLLIPITMIIIGSYYAKKAPKKINSISGYRTPMSMKNKDTWEFAHTYCGKLWRVIGWVMLPVSVFAMVLVMGKEIVTVGTFGLGFSIIQCVVLIIPIIPTERALRKNFDEHGNRIE